MIQSTPASEPPLTMTRDEYFTWAEQRISGRYERINGVVVARDGTSAMAPERASHNLQKFRTALVLDTAVRSAGWPCNVFTDGMTVSVEDSDYEPDAIVRCGPPLSGNTIAVPDPLIIVEVLSPSTAAIDRAWKLQEYFKLPSVRHYLIVWPDIQQIVHHYRNTASQIETQLITTGTIGLDPPGITVLLEDIYSD